MPRPSLEGVTICLRLTPAALERAEHGSMLLAQRTGHSPSRAAWLRLLIDHSLKGKAIKQSCNKENLHKHWPQVQVNAAEMTRQTVRLEDHQRILLRKFECHVQALDWTLEIGRNEAALLLIELYADDLSTHLRTQP